MGSGELCANAGLGSPDFITRTLLPSVEALKDDDVPFVQKERCDKGVATKLTTTKDAAMMEKALEWDFDFSYQEMADALMELFDFTISRQAVAEHLKNADWNVRAQSPHD
jgi:hypothetical protein